MSDRPVVDRDEIYVRHRIRERKIACVDAQLSHQAVSMPEANLRRLLALELEWAIVDIARWEREFLLRHPGRTSMDGAR